MRRRLTDAQRGQLLDMVTEVIRTAVEGDRSFDEVARGLKAISGKRPSATAPRNQAQWGSVESQVEVVKKFLEKYGEGAVGFRPSDIPAAPTVNPRTESGVLLLTVFLPSKRGLNGLGRTFDAWWDFIDPPIGMSKYRMPQLRSGSKDLRLVRGLEYRPGIYWVEFNPVAHQGKATKFALAQSKIDGSRPAGIEVLMAAAQFPEWLSGWNGSSSPYPSMAGLQVHTSTGWTDVPYLKNWVSGQRQLTLAVWDALRNLWISEWCSPDIWDIES